MNGTNASPTITKSFHLNCNTVANGTNDGIELIDNGSNTFQLNNSLGKKIIF